MIECSAVLWKYDVYFSGKNSSKLSTWFIPRTEPNIWYLISIVKIRNEKGDYIFLIKKLPIQVPIWCKAAVCKGATAAINGEDLLQWQEGVITPSRGLISSSQLRNNIQPAICTPRRRARSFYAMTGVARKLCLSIVWSYHIKLCS